MLGGGIVMALLNAVQLVVKAPCLCYTLSSAVTYVLCHGTHRLTSHFLAVKNDNSLKKKQYLPLWYITRTSKAKTCKWLFYVSRQLGGG